MSMINDLEYDLMSYCLKLKGKWWANYFFKNKEVDELYDYLRKLDVGTVVAILGCGCSKYEEHIEFHKTVVQPIIEGK